jgi:glutathione peroxidase-family protein
MVSAAVATTNLAAIVRAAEVPRPSPDFAVNLIGGQQVQLSQYKGKVRALAFILTTCPHCQKTVGILSTMQKEYGPRGLQVLASAIEDMAAMNVPDFIKRFQPPFPVGFSNRADVEAYLQHPTIFRMLMPQMVFIDRQGTIRAQYAGDHKFFADDQEKHIRDQIEALLKDAPAHPKK